MNFKKIYYDLNRPGSKKHYKTSYKRTRLQNRSSSTNKCRIFAIVLKELEIPFVNFEGNLNNHLDNILKELLDK